jgi:hypothetical protein
VRASIPRETEAAGLEGAPLPLLPLAPGSAADDAEAVVVSAEPALPLPGMASSFDSAKPFAEFVIAV